MDTLAGMLGLILNRWTVGIAVFVLIRMALGEMFDLTVYCADGWHSPSIGRSGACSYHGGVDAGAVGLANIASVILGIIAGLTFGNIRENGVNIPSKPNSIKDKGEPKHQITPEKANKVAPKTISRKSYALDSKLSTLSCDKKIEIFGECIRCGTRIRWSGLSIELDLQKYSQMTVNEIRGKVKCPDCDSALQLGYIEIKSKL